jgi:PKD repeat protein
VMDMKQFTLAVLLILLVGLTALAGVRLNLDDGNTAGSSEAIGETESSLAATYVGDLTVTVLGGGGALSELSVLTANLSLSHDSVQTLEPVTLDASGSQSAGEITLYEWDLDGDGVFDESSAQSLLTHEFTEDGTISIQLRTTNDLGESALSDVVQLDVINRQPLARFSANPRDTVEGSTVEFIDSSHDDDGLIAAWLWKFGDGTTSSESSPSHIYHASGIYTATLSVADDDGSWSEAYVFEVEVLNQAPQAEFSLDLSMLGAGTPLILSDESFDPSLDGEIVHVAWDFGDGGYQAGGPSTNNAYSHTYTESGMYVISLYVIDDDGAMGLSQITVQIP